MANYKTPGVYVEEVSIIPPSIAEIDSAVPAFVGYTEKAEQLAPNDLDLVPTRVRSLKEYEQYFGGAAAEDSANISIHVTEYKNGAVTTGYSAKTPLTIASMKKHIFYHSVKLFFANGGSDCYIVSVGSYDKSIQKEDLLKGLGAVELEDIPTLIAIPEAVKLSESGYQDIVQAMIKQAATLKDRFALLDTLTTTVPKNAASISEDLRVLKNAAPSDKEIRRYSAAYYPFLETTYSYNFDFNALKITSYQEINTALTPPPPTDLTGSLLGTLKNTKAQLYTVIKNEFEKQPHIILPPSAAVAGIIARIDSEKGYWKAPANAGVANVSKPVANVSFQEQGDLNIDVNNGKSVNAIVSQSGNGTVLMGARTLDGNDNEWRYINVRRFFSIVEESIKKSTAWAVFEPNTGPTWIKVQAMIEGFLFLKWREGALVGAKPEQAYGVSVGLDKTMNQLDILEGRMIIEIKMAVARPTEFIILKFEQKMQTS